MYQSAKIPHSENDFNQMMDIFKKTVAPIDELITAKDDSEWNMDIEYFPNHAAIWNDRDNINRPCHILQKDDSVALVMFTDESGISTRDLVARVYRLEDLSHPSSVPKLDGGEMIHTDHSAGEVVSILEEMATQYLESNKKQGWIDSEGVMNHTCLKYKGESVDAYGSFTHGGVMYLNSYGQSDTWRGDNFDIVAVGKTKIYILEYSGRIDKTTTRMLDLPFPVNIHNFGGKRAYYLTKDHVQLRTYKAFYDTLPVENKYPEGEDDISGPYFAVYFKKERKA